MYLGKDTSINPNNAYQTHKKNGITLKISYKKSNKRAINIIFYKVNPKSDVNPESSCITFGVHIKSLEVVFEQTQIFSKHHFSHLAV